MTFSDILPYLKEFKRVHRISWPSGRHMWLKREFQITPAMCYDPVLRATATEYGMVTGKPTLTVAEMTAEGGTVESVGVVGIQDILADDWSLYPTTTEA